MEQRSITDTYLQGANNLTSGVDRGTTQVSEDQTKKDDGAISLNKRTPGDQPGLKEPPKAGPGDQPGLKEPPKTGTDDQSGPKEPPKAGLGD